MTRVLKNFRFSYFAMITATLIFSSCSTAKEATQSGFLTDYSSLKQGTSFKQEYIAPGVDFSKYKTVKVAPVSLSFLDAKTSCDTSELENLAGEFRGNLEEQLAQKGFTVTSHPGENTLVISLALTNVEPPNRLLNAGLTAATFMAPVPLPFDQDGKTSLEGKITDATTGKLLISFAEERSGSGDEMDLKAMAVGKYQKFTNTQAVFKGWAKTIATLLQDLNSGVDPATKGQTGKQSQSMAKQIVGLAV